MKIAEKEVAQQKSALPSIPIGIESFKSEELSAAQQRREFAKSLAETTPQEAAAIQKMLGSPTATFASQETAQKGFDIVKTFTPTFKAEDVKAMVSVPTPPPVVESVVSPVGKTDSFGMPKLSSLPTIEQGIPTTLKFYPSMPGSIAEQPYNKFGVEDYSSVKLFEGITKYTTPYRQKVQESKILSDIGKLPGIQYTPLGGLRDESVQQFVKGVSKSPAAIVEFGATIPAVGEFILKEPTQLGAAILVGTPLVAKSMISSSKKDPFGFGGELAGQGFIFGGIVKGTGKIINVAEKNIKYTIGTQKPVGVLVEMGETPIYEVPKTLKPFNMQPSAEGIPKQLTSAQPLLSTRLIEESSIPKTPLDSNTFLENVGGRDLSRNVKNIFQEKVTTKSVEPQLLVGKSQTKITEVTTPEVFMGQRVDFKYKVPEKVAQTYLEVPKEQIPEFLKSAQGEVRYVKTPEGSSYMVVKEAKPLTSIEETTPDFNILGRKLVEGGTEFPKGTSLEKVSLIEKLKAKLPRIEKKETLRTGRFVEQKIVDRPLLSARNFDIYAEGRPVTPKGKPFSMDVMPEKVVDVTGKNMYEGAQKIKGIPERAKLTSAKPQELIFMKETPGKSVPKDFETQFRSTEEITRLSPEKFIEPINIPKEIYRTDIPLRTKPMRKVSVITETAPKISQDIKNMFGETEFKDITTEVRSTISKPKEEFKYEPKLQAEKIAKPQRKVQVAERFDRVLESLKEGIQYNKETPYEISFISATIPKISKDTSIKSDTRNIKFTSVENLGKISPIERFDISLMRDTKHLLKPSTKTSTKSQIKTSPEISPTPFEQPQPNPIEQPKPQPYIQPQPHAQPKPYQKPLEVLRPVLDTFWSEELKSEIPQDWVNADERESKKKKPRRKLKITYKPRASPIFEGAEKLFNMGNEGALNPLKTSQVKQTSTKGKNTKVENFDMGFGKEKITKKNKKQFWNV
jgi:hypothetical protein